MRREESEWYRSGFTKLWWKSLSLDERKIFLDELTEEEIEDFSYDWRVWGRDEQLAPTAMPDGSSWRTWLIKTGRGWGKTRTAVEYINDEIELGNSRRIAIVGQGDDDIRRVMIEGKSGFLATARPGRKPIWSPSVNGGQLVWPNGAVGFVHSAEDPEGLRGPEYDTGWFDEPMACPAKKREETISNLRFGLRIVQNGIQPRLIYTTTPKKHRWMKVMLADAKNPKKKLYLTEGKTTDNEENLAEAFIEGILEDYGGTRLGRQEIDGELLGEEEGALWTEEGLEKTRETKLTAPLVAQSCERIVVGVDPNLQPDATAHEAGVVVVGKKGKERFVLADRSCKGGPLKWATAAVEAYIDFGADEVVAEANQGGEMVRLMILAAADELGVDVKVHLTYASKGKQRRAEPAAAAYDRGLVHHVGDAATFEKLETQMTSLHDGNDPTGEDFDRCDALVWALTRLKLKNSSGSASAGGSGIMTFEDFQGGATQQ